MGRRENRRGDRMGKGGEEEGCVDGDIGVKYWSTLTARIYERRKGWCTALHRILLYCRCSALYRTSIYFVKTQNEFSDDILHHENLLVSFSSPYPSQLSNAPSITPHTLCCRAMDRIESSQHPLKLTSRAP
jgi:hypothetical protein